MPNAAASWALVGSVRTCPSRTIAIGRVSALRPALSSSRFPASDSLLSKM